MNVMTKLKKLKKLSLRSKLETIARAYGAGIDKINVVNSVKNWSNGDVFGKANVANFDNSDNFVNSVKNWSNSDVFGKANVANFINSDNS